MNELVKRSVSEHSAALQSGAYSAKELTKTYLDAIDETDGTIGAYISLYPEEALAAAAAVDEKRAKGESLSPLAGIPAGIKDNDLVPRPHAAGFQRADEGGGAAGDAQCITRADGLGKLTFKPLDGAGKVWAVVAER